MTDTPDNIELTLLVNPTGTGAGEDLDELDDATRSLRAELAELPIDAVSLATAGEVPAGAKAGDAVALGTLTLTLAPIVVPALIEFLKSWMARKEGRTIVIRKKLGDAETNVEIKGPLSESAISAIVERLSSQKKPAPKPH